MENNITISKILIKHQADCNIKNNVLQTPLHIAVSDGKYEIIKLLVSHGVDSNEKDASRWTAYEIGNRHFDKKILQLLKPL
ncbi:hypothetical protein TVAG_305920 [Trichomonas vaginalis G3]|uniref:Uncharacterized protein n=1 Tax=Trichomonas vaginalis (strain ATCC PRA-98 / G3) TaxID=412133 RepID=A2DN84_TRIV3|nr:Ankyrin repeat family [Trichomonas vaginalis G3]EAY18072.1 hypothetical protein TVAG_305920 [Trichomonas vaginalis G3]KAI5492347.1 Ankyrin repeat family [Trichomonas vaginalis G3]|eukprot:XP_001579058.1 hypothetical protein [Trichomonas vaginalis G3]